MELPGELNGFFAVSSFAHDFHIRFIFEHATESTANKAVVIHE
jgi:hypothetical protein